MTIIKNGSHITLVNYKGYTAAQLTDKMVIIIKHGRLVKFERRTDDVTESELCEMVDTVIGGI